MCQEACLYKKCQDQRQVEFSRGSTESVLEDVVDTIHPVIIATAIGSFCTAQYQWICAGDRLQRDRKSLAGVRPEQRSGLKRIASSKPYRTI